MENPQVRGAPSDTRLQHQRLSDDQIIRSQELGLSRLVATGAIADARGALIVSTNIAMLGALIGAFSSGPPARAATTVWIVLGITFLSCVASAVASTMAAFPRLLTRSESIVFFGNISALSADAYFERLQSATCASYAHDLATQCHRVASIVAIKFRCIRAAMALLIVAAIPWLVCLYFARRIPLPV